MERRCEARHGERFCTALERRAAIRWLRGLIRDEERRLERRPRGELRLSWRLGRLRRGVHWHRHVVRALRRVPTPQVPYLAEFTCIHHGEGAWNANTGNGYYGGLQMNMDFMKAYGAALLAQKGTANNWTPREQIAVAGKAVPSRGFHPWPQTAAKCGLL